MTMSAYRDSPSKARRSRAMAVEVGSSAVDGDCTSVDTANTTPQAASCISGPAMRATMAVNTVSSAVISSQPAASGHHCRTVAPTVSGASVEGTWGVAGWLLMTAELT